MRDEALDRFRAYLSKRDVTGRSEQDLLLHDLGATINRHRLTGRDEGITSFNTVQLCCLVLGQPNWSRDQPFVTGLMLSSLIDGEIDIFDAARSEGLIPPTWSWATWANGFSGDEAELCRLLGAIQPIRERCGAVCLAVRGNARAIGPRLLGEFCTVALAKVYHRLFRAGLAGDQSSIIAASELTRLADNLEVLFAEDTDATIAALVKASSLDHPERHIVAFKDAVGDLTRTAVAQRHLEMGRPQEALALVRDLRILSPAYDQAILVAALSALESKKFEMADFYSRSIANEDARLKIVTRIALATGDTSIELDALGRLHERNPHDAEIFIMLINLLMRIGQAELATALCAQAQETFHDNQTVARFTRLILTRGSSSV